MYMEIIIYFVSLVICLFCRKHLFKDNIKKVKHVIGYVPWEDNMNAVCNVFLILSYIPFCNTIAAIGFGIVTFFKYISDSNNNFLNKDI